MVNPLAIQNTSSIQLIRAKELAAQLGIGISTLYDWLNPTSPRYDANFPKAISIGSRAKAWSVTAIN